MKIGVDFDDVVVHTMEEFVRLWNKSHTRQKDELVYEDIDDWDLVKRLGVTEKTVHGYFMAIDYDNISPVPDSIIGIRDLLDDGHEVTILSSNKRQGEIRHWLDNHGLRMVPLWVGLKNKAKFARDAGYDALVDDKPQTLRDAVVLGLHTIRFVTPWNKNMNSVHDGTSGLGSSWGVAPLEYTERTWAGVLRAVRGIAYKSSQPAAASYSKRNILTNIAAMRSPDQEAWDVYSERNALSNAVDWAARGEYPFPLGGPKAWSEYVKQKEVPTITNAVRSPYSERVEEKREEMERACLSIGPVPGKDYEEPVIANAKGAKQSDIGARFDLLPARAVARVAEVLHHGAEKYGEDNWRGLSVDEINNHTIGHLMNYVGRGAEQDLAHAACRALMALEIKLQELEAETILPDDPGWEHNE